MQQALFGKQISLSLCRSCIFLVDLEVALEELLERPQQPLHRVAIHRDEHAVRLGDHVGGSGFVLDEGTLAEVVTDAVLHHLFGRLTRIERLSGDRSTFLQ